MEETDYEWKHNFTKLMSLERQEMLLTHETRTVCYKKETLKEQWRASEN